MHTCLTIMGFQTHRPLHHMATVLQCTQTVMIQLLLDEFQPTHTKLALFIVHNRYDLTYIYQVLDDESNFVYAEFKVILELDVNTHFIWNASNNLHSTTMNRVFSKQPKSWKTFTKSLMNANLAQWSRANVLIHNAVSNGLRGSGDQEGDKQ